METRSASRQATPTVPVSGQDQTPRIAIIALSVGFYQGIGVFRHVDSISCCVRCNLADGPPPNGSYCRLSTPSKLQNTCDNHHEDALATVVVDGSIMVSSHQVARAAEQTECS